MKTSIIIPVYNEENTIDAVIKKTLNINLDKEIIVVDDGSTDGSCKKIEKFSKDITLIKNPTNLGKGISIRRGMLASTGEIITILDADLEYDPNDLIRPICKIRLGKADVVFGSRFIYGNRHRYWFLYFGNILLSKLTSILYWRKVTDMMTGTKIFLKKLIDPKELTATGFDIEPELTSLLLTRCKQYVEVPISYHSRSYGEGKKIKMKDGVKAIIATLWFKFI